MQVISEADLLRNAVFRPGQTIGYYIQSVDQV